MSSCDLFLSSCFIHFFRVSLCPPHVPSCSLAPSPLPFLYSCVMFLSFLYCESPVFPCLVCFPCDIMFIHVSVFPVCSHFLIILRCFYVSFSLGPVLRSPLFLCVSLCASLCPLFIYISSLVCISFGLAIKLCLSYFCLRESAFGTFPACCTAKFMTQRPKTLQTLHTSTQRNFQVHIGL